MNNVSVLVSGNAIALGWPHDGKRYHVWFKDKAIAWGELSIDADGRGLYVNQLDKLAPTRLLPIEPHRAMIQEAIAEAIRADLLPKALELDAQRAQRDQEEFERQRRKAILETFAIDMHEALQLVRRDALDKLPAMTKIYVRGILDKIALTLARDAPTSTTKE